MLCNTQIRVFCSHGFSVLCQRIEIKESSESPIQKILSPIHFSESAIRFFLSAIHFHQRAIRCKKSGGTKTEVCFWVFCLLREVEESGVMRFNEAMVLFAKMHCLFAEFVGRSFDCNRAFCFWLQSGVDCCGNSQSSDT